LRFESGSEVSWEVNRFSITGLSETRVILNSATKIEIY
jgi:hypothetical protein